MTEESENPSQSSQPAEPSTASPSETNPPPAATTAKSSMSPTTPSSPEPRLSINIPDRSSMPIENTAVVNTPMALKMATDMDEAEPKQILPNIPDESSPSSIMITLLILSGARSSFSLSPEYLKRHNVKNSDPLTMTVYNLKECIWRDWKEDELMTPQPTSPHLIRLILLGRLLEDKSLLKDCRLQLESPNVVHLSLRPSDIDPEEVNPKSGKHGGFGGSSGRSGERSSPSCRCVIL